MLEAMIAAKAVTSAFQPIVSCETGEVAGFEALARPNSTPEVFCDKRFVDSLYRAVRDIPGLTPSRIVLEITERGGADDLERIAEQVTELKALGFQIAIDDVGAGTSGLNRIMMLRPHWLKLDRELVSNIDSNRYKLNLIRFMIHFARLSGVNVIAEGIERREELDTLIELGVKYVQGFLIGKPNFSYTTLDENLSLAMRTKWAASQAARLADPRRTLIGQLAEPAEAVQAHSLVREVALRILRLPGLSGVAVLDGTRLVGWASREVILAGARRNDKNLQIGYICGNDLGSLSPTATVTEALEMVAQRENAYVADPIVISEHDRVSGIVTLKRLLGAAVGEAKLTGGSISGLPTRVDAEKKLRSLIAARSDALDCAFVDIRGFSDYNGACGYESGDKLISDLTGLLRLAATGPRPQDWFVAHLGDDRFLIIGPADDLPTVLSQIIDRFEREAPATPAFLGPVGAAPEASDPQVLLRLGLRIIHLPNVFTRVKTLRQLTNLEQEVRRTLRSGPTTPDTRSIHVRDVDLGDQRATA
ncbi:MAG: EAL domain-containing protein [Phycisphaerales bacterium]|nr:EAL domain-containing protein [Phycisphaerales bacterium]